MNSDDPILHALQTEKDVEQDLLRDYTACYSGLKDENLRLMMKELLLLGITQYRIASELIKYMQDKPSPSSVAPPISIPGNVRTEPASKSSLPPELSNFSQTDCVIVELDPMDWGVFVSSTMRRLVSDLGFTCVYVSVTKPLVVVKELMTQTGVDMSRMRFIECSGTTEKGDVISPESLEELNFRIDSFAEASQGRRVVFIDTISALRVYNPDHVILDYVNIASKRAKTKGYGLIIMDVPSGDHPMNPVIRTFVDKVVSFNPQEAPRRPA